MDFGSATGSMQALDLLLPRQWAAIYGVTCTNNRRSLPQQLRAGWLQPAWAPKSKLTPWSLMTTTLAAAVFMGEEECEFDDQGRFFFDHDPSNFNLVLNYMRSGECVIPYERGAFESFQKDVGFWRLDVLEARVSNALRRRTHRNTGDERGRDLMGAC